MKDKLGDLTSSDNYRAIAISSLLLKIFDWIVLLLHEDKLSTADLQFGFQTDSSTVMCSWIASEVISYYNRNKTNVYCCLLDLKTNSENCLALMKKETKFLTNILQNR